MTTSQFETGDREVNEVGASQSKITTSLTLVPPLALLNVGVVLKVGEMKYGADNWRNIPVDDHLDHLLKHVYEYLINRDPRDLVHACCRALFASELHPPAVQPLKDDTPYEQYIRDAEREASIAKLIELSKSLVKENDVGTDH